VTFSPLVDSIESLLHLFLFVAGEFLFEFRVIETVLHGVRVILKRIGSFDFLFCLFIGVFEFLCFFE